MQYASDNILELLDSMPESIPADERQKLRTALLALQVELKQVLEGMKCCRLANPDVKSYVCVAMFLECYRLLSL